MDDEPLKYVIVSRKDWKPEELDYWTKNTNAKWIFGD